MRQVPLHAHDGEHEYGSQQQFERQGLNCLAKLQASQPEFRDLTLYYFGDTDPANYGIAGRSYVIRAIGDQSQLPTLDGVQSHYIGVSASLEWGPWGPAGFFKVLNGLKPVCFTGDTTIAIYRTADVGVAFQRAKGQ